MFHESAIGTRSRNLDMFFTDVAITKYLFGRAAKDCDISVTEGVMGFYDGLGGGSTDASSYDLSCKLDMPVILLVDCKGSSVSIVALIKGFSEFRKNNIKGVILNNMPEKLYPSIKEMIENELDLKVIGYVPNVKDIVIESRHLGLLLPNEIDGMKDRLNKLADILEKTLDIDSIIRLADSAPNLDYNEPDIPYDGVSVKIGVAFDECFCFMYKDNIELLERLGAKIVYFSPVNDKKMPEGIGGMILPGGYPELFAKKLSENRTMLNDIRKRIGEGMPCMAECGGFMYLHDELEDPSGKYHKMVGVIDGKAFRTENLSRFGYMTITSRTDGILAKGSEIKGHEFHYWDSTNCGDDCEAVKTSGMRYDCMHNTGSIAAGFPHLYYYSDPGTAHEFLLRCASYLDRVRE
jgi:cobyrinic acid a,c-diamide synthase